MFKKQGYITWLLLGVVILVILWQTGTIEGFTTASPSVPVQNSMVATPVSSNPQGPMPTLEPGRVATRDSEIDGLRREIRDLRTMTTQIMDNHIMYLYRRTAELGNMVNSINNRLKLMRR